MSGYAIAIGVMLFLIGVVIGLMWGAALVLTIDRGARREAEESERLAVATMVAHARRDNQDDPPETMSPDEVPAFLRRQAD